MKLAKRSNHGLSAVLVPAVFGFSAMSAGVQSAVIEEIITTAEFREKSTMDTAISMSAFDKTLMDKFRMEDSDDVARQTPNVQIGQSFGQASPRIAIRGVVNADFGTQASTPVTVYSDGVVLNNPAIQSFAMYDLERVEVLRGPQGTLYGRNATTGSLNFISAKPTEELSGFAMLTAAEHGQLRFEGAVSGSITDDVRGRLSINRGLSDGWTDNVINGQSVPEQDDFSIRGILDFNIGEDVTVFLKAQYSEYDGDPGLFHTIAPINSFTGQPNPGPANDYNQIALDGTDNQELIESDDLVLQVDWDLGNMVLTSLTGYNDHDRFDFNDADGQGLFLFNWLYAHQSEQLSQEFRLTSTTDGPLSWIAGLYYLDETIEAQSRFELFGIDPAFVGPTAGQGYDGDQDLTSFAGFVQLDYEISEQWLVGLGVRYTDDKKEISYSGCNFYQFDRQNARSFIDPALVVGCLGIGGDVEDEESWDAFSGSLSIQYRPNDRTMIYANVSNGFKGGAYNLSTADFRLVNPVDPEDLWSYEAGIKWESENRDVVMSANAFIYDYQDLHQFTFVDLNAGTGNPPNLASFLENIEEAEIKGAEVEMMFAPSANMLINLGFSWNEAEFTKFQSFGGDLGGNALPSSPEYTFNGVIQYNFNLGDTWVITPQVDWSWTDEMYPDTVNSKTAVVASQNPAVPDQLVDVEIEEDWDVNLRLTVASEELGIAVTAFIENVGEDQGDIEHHFLGGVEASFGSTFAKIAQPETYGVTLSYRF